MEDPAVDDVQPRLSEEQGFSISSSASQLDPDKTRVKTVDRPKTSEKDETAQSNNSEIVSKRDCSYILNRRVLLAIVLGQTLSLLICGTAVTSGLLQQQGISIPTAQAFLNYLLLGLVYGTLLACRGGDRGIFTVMRHRGWIYLLLALIDVEANYMIVKAYHYTTVTSVQLLDCITIAVVLLLSWIFLKVRYKCLHFVGVGVCVFGVISLVVADVLTQKHDALASNRLLGDMLCLAGASLYGVSNVGQEYMINIHGRVEFLGMIGLLGSLINGIQLLVLERQEVSNVLTSTIHQPGVWIPLLGFAVCLFLLYSLMPVVIGMTSATALNLNLLTADFYAILAGLFIFYYSFHLLYIASILLLLGGLLIYSLQPPGTASTNTVYQVIRTDEEGANTDGVNYQVGHSEPTESSSQRLQAVKYSVYNPAASRTSDQSSLVSAPQVSAER